MGAETCDTDSERAGLGSFSLGHRPALDGIRAVAALAVVGFHARVPGFSNGGVGVDVFFTLSGFLITTILLNSLGPRGELDYRTFYFRRALRLLPVYFVVVVAAVATALLTGDTGTLQGAVLSFFYVANWGVALFGISEGGLLHTWSLSVEEQFYLLWPVLLVLCVRRCRGSVPKVRVLIAVLVVAAYVLALGLLAVGVSVQAVQNATPTRAVQLLFGAWLAICLCQEGVRRYLDTHRLLRHWGGVLCLTGLVVWMSQGPDAGATVVISWPAVTLLTCGLIFFVLHGTGPSAAVLSLRPVVAVGRTSYGLYLWHFPVLVTIDEQWGLDSWESRAWGIGISAVLVPLSYVFIERPFLAMKDKIAPRATRTPQTTQVSLTAQTYQAVSLPAGGTERAGEAAPSFDSQTPSCEENPGSSLSHG